MDASTSSVKARVYAHTRRGISLEVYAIETPGGLEYAATLTTRTRSHRRGRRGSLTPLHYTPQHRSFLAAFTNAWDTRASMIALLPAATDTDADTPSLVDGGGLGRGFPPQDGGAA